MADEVLEALRAMRPPFALYEADIHRMVEDRLTACGLAFGHEVRLAQGCRIDYMVGGVGVEIKKGKPKQEVLLGQLERYARCEQVESLIVISWQSVRLPAQIVGKPLYLLPLSQLWGVSLP